MATTNNGETDRPRRLSKRDVEILLRDYDVDPVTALTAALRVVLHLPGAQWAELLDASGLPPGRRAALAAEQVAALDDLVAELNEERGIRP
jgi:hypothetical protein